MPAASKLPEHTLVVVADGGGARIFRNHGKGGQVQLGQTELIDPAQLPYTTPAGNQPPEVPGEEIEEAGFAKRLANRLNEDALKHGYEHLVLMADQQTLGQVRPLLHKEVQARLLAEYPKNFSNAPLEDIERALAGG